MFDYKDKEKPRSEFKGMKMEGFYADGIWVPWGKEMVGEQVAKQDIYYPIVYSWMKLMVGMFPIVLLAATTVIVAVSILAIRLILQNTSASLIGGLLGAVANAISINILNAIYGKLAVTLTNWGILVGNL
jgi:hypothetical protein